MVPLISDVTTPVVGGLGLAILSAGLMFLRWAWRKVVQPSVTQAETNATAAREDASAARIETVNLRQDVSFLLGKDRLCQQAVTGLLIAAEGNHIDIPQHVRDTIKRLEEYDVRERPHV